MQHVHVADISKILHSDIPDMSLHENENYPAGYNALFSPPTVHQTIYDHACDLPTSSPPPPPHTHMNYNLPLCRICSYLSSYSPCSYYLSSKARLQGRSGIPVTVKSSSKVSGLIKRGTQIEKDVMDMHSVVGSGGDDRRVLLVRHTV